MHSCSQESVLKQLTHPHTHTHAPTRTHSNALSRHTHTPALFQTHPNYNMCLLFSVGRRRGGERGIGRRSRGGGGEGYEPKKTGACLKKWVDNTSVRSWKLGWMSFSALQNLCFRSSADQNELQNFNSHRRNNLSFFKNTTEWGWSYKNWI